MLTLISDLKECINLLPASWSGQDLARATSGAAATLLGKIYLRNHDYANAKTYIDMVLNSGQYELESDFKYVWSENNKYGKEMILLYCMKREIMRRDCLSLWSFGSSGSTGALAILWRIPSVLA